MQFLLGKGHYSIDVVRALIIEQYGGLYMDTDVHVKSSLLLLHSIFDSYVSLEMLDVMIGVGCGIFGAKPNHPIVTTWLNMLREFHGLPSDSNHGVQ